MSVSLEQQYTADVGRAVWLRPDTSDRQVWSDTFVGRYHLPPVTMPEPSRVLDLGSNIGLTCAHYKALWPDAQVVGVEPSPSNADLAVLNTPADVEILRCAVTGREGMGRYDERARHEAFEVSMTDVTPATNDHLVATRCARLTDVILEAFGEALVVDFVKMDIEGSEWGVFADTGWADLVRYLTVEVHPGHYANDTEELLDRGYDSLETLGFTVLKHRDTPRLPSPHPRGLWAWR